MSYVPIDLSMCVGEMMEKCVSHLSSQRPETRQDTRELVEALCVQCSDTSAAAKAFSILTTALKSMHSVKEHFTS